MSMRKNLGYSNLYVKYAGVLLDKNICVNLWPIWKLKKGGGVE